MANTKKTNTKVSKNTNTKKNENKKVEKKDNLINVHIRIENLGILIQLVLSIVLLMFIGYSIFITEFYNLTVGLLTALAFTMAYNNYTTYKKKHFTTIYCIIGIAGVTFLLGTLF